MDKARIAAVVSAAKEEIVTFLREMIRIPSENPPGDYGPISTYLAAKLEAMGLAVEMVGKSAVPAVLATLKGDRPGARLILNPHYDVVPAGEGWSHAPYGGELDGGRIYGRGAYDCKGRIAVFASALKLLCENEATFNGEIVLAVVGDEETGGDDGTKYLLDQGLLKGDMCIGEGSDEMLWAIHKGVLHFEIHIKGKANHGGRCWMGVSAVDKAVPVLNLLMGLKRKYEQLGSRFEGRFNRFTTFNIGKIRGGLKVNSVPDFCTISVDCRVAPDFTTAAVWAEITSGLEQLQTQDPQFRYRLEVFLKEEPEVLDRDSPLFEAVQWANRQWNGEDLPLEATYAISDARFFRRAGIPTISFCGPGGPGKGIQGHCVDEFVEVAQLLSSTKMMMSILLRLMKNAA